MKAMKVMAVKMNLNYSSSNQYEFYDRLYLQL